jgi:hypothetical protein
MSVASKESPPFKADCKQETGKNQLQPGQESIGDATVLSNFFVKKSLTNTDWCVGALS